MDTRKHRERISSGAALTPIPERWRALPDHLAAMDRVVSSPPRLFILGVLAAQEDGVNFKHLLALTQLTAGNLNAHLARLERAGYVEVRKSFQGRTPSTSYVLNATGQAALAHFLEHLDALLDLIRHAEEAGEMRGVPGFYTAKEAQSVLHVNADQFQYLVRAGRLERVILPGRVYGVYPQVAVDQLAAATEALIKQYTQSASTDALVAPAREDNT